MVELAVIYGTGTGHTGEIAEQIDDGARLGSLKTEVREPPEQCPSCDHPRGTSRSGVKNTETGGRYDS